MRAAHNPTNPRLAIALKPSRQLAAYVAACHLLAAVALVLSALPWPFLGAALAALGWHLYAWLGSYRQRAPAALYYEGNYWYLEIGGRRCPLALAGEQLVWPRLVILRGCLATGRHCVLVLPADAAGADDLRQLRVLLRLVGPQNPNS